MSIKVNELQADLKAKFNNVIADGKITVEEWNRFSPEEQEQLSQGLGGKAPAVGEDLKLNVNYSEKPQNTEKTPESKRAELSWGKIGKIGLKSIGNFFKSMVCDENGFSLKRTLTTAGVIAGTAALAAVSVPAALAAGAVMGGVMLVDGGIKAVKGTKEYYNAETEEEAEKAMEKAMDGGVEAGFGVAALFGVKKGYNGFKKARAQKAQEAQSAESTQSSGNNNAVQDIHKTIKENGTEVTLEYKGGGYSIQTRVRKDGCKCTLEKQGLDEKFTEFDSNGNIKLQYEKEFKALGGTIETETVIKDGKQITRIVETEGYGPNHGKVKNYKQYSDGELKTNRSYEYTSEGVIETRTYSGGSKKRTKLDKEPEDLELRLIKDRYWQGDGNMYPNVGFSYYSQWNFEKLW